MTEIAHKDKLGQPINISDYVAAPFGPGDLKVCIVEKLTKKMITVKPIDNRYTKHKYPSEVVILDSKAVTRYLLSR